MLSFFMRSTSLNLVEFMFPQERLAAELAHLAQDPLLSAHDIRRRRVDLKQMRIRQHCSQ